MTTKLEQIRYAVEQNVKTPVENADIINWCNDAQTELMLFVDIPATFTIPLNTNDLSYAFTPVDMKGINRLWLQSERDSGVDRDIPNPYRIYQGQIIFAYRFNRADTLNIDYYRHMKNFTVMSDTIDLDDREAPLYTSYCLAQYYDNPQVIERMGQQQALKKYEQHYGRHLSMRESIAAKNAALYQPATIKEAY